MSLKKMSPTLVARGRYEFRVRSRVRAFAGICGINQGSITVVTLPVDGAGRFIEKGFFDAQG
jgi:hypothetical protein